MTIAATAALALLAAGRELEARVARVDADGLVAADVLDRASLVVAVDLVIEVPLCNAGFERDAPRFSMTGAEVSVSSGSERLSGELLPRYSTLEDGLEIGEGGTEGLRLTAPTDVRRGGAIWLAGVGVVSGSR